MLHGEEGCLAAAPRWHRPFLLIWYWLPETEAESRSARGSRHAHQIRTRGSRARRAPESLIPGQPVPTGASQDQRRGQVMRSDPPGHSAIPTACQPRSQTKPACRQNDRRVPQGQGSQPPAKEGRPRTGLDSRRHGGCGCAVRVLGSSLLLTSAPRTHPAPPCYSPPRTLVLGAPTLGSGGRGRSLGGLTTVCPSP